MKTRCDKCGNGHHNALRYEPATRTYRTMMGVVIPAQAEHMAVTCVKCGHEWATTCADAKEGDTDGTD